jgi:hypothetical protein
MYRTPPNYIRPYDDSTYFRRSPSPPTSYRIQPESRSHFPRPLNNAPHRSTHRRYSPRTIYRNPSPDSSHVHVVFSTERCFPVSIPEQNKFHHVLVINSHTISLTHEEAATLTQTKMFHQACLCKNTLPPGKTFTTTSTMSTQRNNIIGPLPQGFITFNQLYVTNIAKPRHNYLPKYTGSQPTIKEPRAYLRPDGQWTNTHIEQRTRYGNKDEDNRDLIVNAYYK